MKRAEWLAATLVEEIDRPSFPTQVLPLSGASDLKQVLSRIDVLVKKLKGVSGATFSANLIFGVRISAGSMEIRLDLHVLSKKLDVPRADIFEEGLIFEKPFQLRKRGVETKLVLGGIQTELDKTLIRNIVAAQKWFAAIRQWRTLDEVAYDAGTTKRRILQMMERTSLVNFPCYQGKYGEKLRFYHKSGKVICDSGLITVAYRTFPYCKYQENIYAYQGMYLSEQGSQIPKP